MDFVDLSSNELKSILAVSDYLILGVMGLVDQGETDYKIIAIEVNEAKQKNITTLETYKRQHPGVLEEI